MKTQTPNISIRSLRSLVDQGGMMVLAKERYDQIIKQIVQQEATIRKLMEEISLNAVITQGEQEFAQGYTITAPSSKEALKQRHARRDT